jgi:hypothetical protein
MIILAIGFPGLHKFLSRKTLLTLGIVCAQATSGSATTLEDRVPGLFPDLMISISPRLFGSQPPLAKGLRELSAALATFRAQAPIPSAAGTFEFKWDPDALTYRRSTKGPGLADRASTLGWHLGTLNVSYTHIDFDRLQGNSLKRLRSSQPALTEEFVGLLPPHDQMRVNDDTLETHVDFAVRLDQAFVTAAYGITDRVDLSLSLSLNRVSLGADGLLTIADPEGDGTATFSATFLPTQRCAEMAETCATDAFDDSAFGTGDIFLRGKWHFYDSLLADLAVAGLLTLPTGNADELLGFHDPTFTPWLIASKDFRRLSPHFNLGYAFRSGDDVSQLNWIVGTDIRAFEWLIFAADFLGYHDDKRDGVNDDVIQAAVGFKMLPFHHTVFSGTFQFPVDSDGLRADVIFTAQIEYTFSLWAD